MLYKYHILIRADILYIIVSKVYSYVIVDYLVLYIVMTCLCMTASNRILLIGVCRVLFIILNVLQHYLNVVLVVL